MGEEAIGLDEMIISELSSACSLEMLAGAEVKVGKGFIGATVGVEFPVEVRLGIGVAVKVGRRVRMTTRLGTDWAPINSQAGVAMVKPMNTVNQIRHRI
jgi:hypothetical protein